MPSRSSKDSNLLHALRAFRSPWDWAGCVLAGGLLLAAWVAWYGGWQQVPLTFPLLGGLLYWMWRDRAWGDQDTLSGLIILALIVVGMTLGPLQGNPWANHSSHLLVSLMLTLLVYRQLQVHVGAGGWVLAWMTAGMVLLAGVGMELGEALAHLGDVDGRYTDTMLDLLADLLGLGWGLAWMALRRPKDSQSKQD